MARRRGRAEVAEAFYAGDWPDSSVASRRFGGRWTDVLTAAGCPARAPGPAE
jgi:hypothetical protein